jgi:transposase
MDKDALAAMLGRGLSVERIAQRLRKHPSTVSYWIQKHGLAAMNERKHAPKGGIARERLAALVDSGLSTREIAAEVGLSQTGVRHWLKRHDLSTRASERAEQVREARDAGRIVMRRTCGHHGQTEFTLEAGGYYRCKRCRMERVAQRRRRLKEMLVSDAGGGCCVCGYDRYIGALQFHHLDPAQKRLEISRNGVTLSLAALRAEAAKCVLLCSNCHAEVEAGVAQVAATTAEMVARVWGARDAPREPP